MYSNADIVLITIAFGLNILLHLILYISFRVYHISGKSPNHPSKITFPIWVYILQIVLSFVPIFGIAPPIIIALSFIIEKDIFVGDCEVIRYYNRYYDKSKLINFLKKKI